MEQKSVWLRKEQTSAALGILRLQIAFRRLGRRDQGAGHVAEEPILGLPRPLGPNARLLVRPKGHSLTFRLRTR